MEKEFICCICGAKCYGYGNNPNGAVWRNENGTIVEGVFKDTDRCCDECDNKYVIAGRMYKLRKEGII